MADIYLGPTISAATLLPRFRWVSGHTPEFPIVYEKQVERVGVLSGGRRFNIKNEHHRKWEFYWDHLTDTDMATLISLCEQNSRLWLQNGWEGAAWHEVVIASVEYYSPTVKTDMCGGYFIPTIYSVPFYGDAYYQGEYIGKSVGFSFAMTLEEAN